MTGTNRPEALEGGQDGLRHKLRTCLFLEDAEAAASFYVSLLPDSRIETIVRPTPGGPALVVEFILAGAPCMTLAGNADPAPSHISSLSVLTADQSETDALWSALIANGGEEGRCGWLKDRFGVHWQIVPTALPRLMSGGDAAASQRVQMALMKMRKIDIAALEAAHAGA
jgi:predicted 3-demethylubiquinone-9 3-methyltransferase (glyoxalase superfamily)